MTQRVIIILGSALAQDGSIQPVLESRLKEAISIYNQSTDTMLVCGNRPPKAVAPERCEHTTEAEMMKQYLILNNVPVETIVKEDESATTFGNALFSYLNVLKGTTTYQSIIVVSNEFHGPLVKYCFDKVFGEQYAYEFHAAPDVISGTALEQTKHIINQLVKEHYPLLFGTVNNGDIDAIQSIIENSSQRILFESGIKKLLNLDENADIVIASEAEIHQTSCNISRMR